MTDNVIVELQRLNQALEAMTLIVTRIDTSLAAINGKKTSAEDFISTVADTLVTTSTFFAAIVTGILVSPQSSDSTTSTFRPQVAYYSFISILLFILALVLSATAKILIHLVSDTRQWIIRLLCLTLLVAAVLEVSGLGLIILGVICNQSGHEVGDDRTCLPGGYSITVIMSVAVGPTLFVWCIWTSWVWYKEQR